MSGPICYLAFDNSVLSHKRTPETALMLITLNCTKLQLRLQMIFLEIKAE